MAKLTKSHLQSKSLSSHFTSDPQQYPASISYNFENVKVHQPQEDADIFIIEGKDEEAVYLNSENDLEYLLQEPSKQNKLINGYCYVCGNQFLGIEPDRCCGGNMCGCMGMPTDPSQIVCSNECYDQLMKPKNNAQ